MIVSTNGIVGEVNRATDRTVVEGCGDYGAGAFVEPSRVEPHEPVTLHVFHIRVIAAVQPAVIGGGIGGIDLRCTRYAAGAGATSKNRMPGKASRMAFT